LVQPAPHPCDPLRRWLQSRNINARHKGNRVAAAQELRMHRSTLWRKLRQYGFPEGS
jgi:DNA-binding NtrC family response regulator